MSKQVRDGSMDEKRPKFGGFELRGGRIYQGGSYSDVSGSTATWWCEQSNKGPSLARAFGGLLGGAALGALFGFLIVGGILMVAVFAIVFGVVAGFKQIEHGQAHVVVNYPDGRVADIPGPLTDWQDAQRLAEAITAFSSDA